MQHRLAGAHLADPTSQSCMQARRASSHRKGEKNDEWLKTAVAYDGRGAAQRSRKKTNVRRAMRADDY